MFVGVGVWGRRGSEEDFAEISLILNQTDAFFPNSDTLSRILADGAWPGV